MSASTSVLSKAAVLAALMLVAVPVAADDGEYIRASVRVDVSQPDAEVFVDGFRTIRAKLYLSPGASRTLRYTMEPLAPGEAPDSPLSSSLLRPAVTTRDPMRIGAIALRVQPADAEVFIDGVKWAAFRLSDLTTIRMDEGRHRITVKRDGFTTYAEDLLIRNGGTLKLDVALAR